MSRIVMSLECNAEGRVLAEFDLDEFASKVRADAIEQYRKALLDYKSTDEQYRSFEEVTKEVAKQVMSQYGYNGYQE